VTWFAHSCHYCGYRHKDVDMLLNSVPSQGIRYQCVDRMGCERRRAALTTYARYHLDIRGFLP
jgi:hypothetical protein